MADVVRPGENAGPPNGNLPANVDLIVYKGDYFEILVNIKDGAGAAVNIVGQTPKAHLKTGYDDFLPTSFTCVLTGTPGQVKLSLTSDVSSTLIPGSYIYDLQLTDGSGNVRTYMSGDVTVYNEVTVG